MVEHIKELFKYRELLLTIVWRDIKIKYKQSLMGFMWAIFMPMLIILSGILVKYAMAMVSGKAIAYSDIATVSVKALPWSFFVASVRFATNSLLGNTNLVTKIYFPKEVFPIAAVLSNLFDFLIAWCTLAVVLTITKIGWSVHLVWLPGLLAILMILLIGCGMLLSSLSLFFRDVKYIVEVLLTFGIFFTPVFYEAKMLGKWSNVILLNPVAPIIEAFNSCVIQQSAPDLGWLGYSAAVSFIMLCFGYPIFKKLEPAFAENI
jgi:lipopolysaccharide transport system permease protein